MSWILENKLKRQQKLREQEERRRQRLEETSSPLPIIPDTSPPTNIHLTTSNHDLLIRTTTKSPKSLASRFALSTNTTSPTGSPTTSPGKPLDRATSPPSFAKPSKNTSFQSFRLSLSDDDEDADGKAVESCQKSFMDRGLSFSDDDENFDAIDKKEHSGSPFQRSFTDDTNRHSWLNSVKNQGVAQQQPSPAVFDDKVIDNKKDKSGNDDDDDDDDDDSFGGQELQEFRRLLQQKESSQSTNNPSSTSTGSPKAHSDKAMSQHHDSVEEFIVTQNDSIQDSDDEIKTSMIPQKTAETHNHDSPRGDDSSLDEEGNVATYKLRRPMRLAPSTPKTPLRDEHVSETVGSVPNANNNHDDSLWSDSEPEQDDREAKDSRKATRKRKRASKGEAPTKHRHVGTPKHTNYATNMSMNFWDKIPVLQQNASLLVETNDQKLKAELHPNLDDPKFGPCALEPLVLTHNNSQHQVPAALNRYLAPFQQEGVKFMYNCLMNNMGCVLGDDMGCGKTVQVMSLLSALFTKTGTGLDVKKIDKRKKLIKARVQKQQQQEEQALLEGRVTEACQPSNLVNVQELQLPQRWWPVLIVVPPTVLENWENEFARFTHFSVATYADKGRDVALSQITSGMAEVMLTKRSTYANPDDFHALNSIPLKWKLVIIDEFHVWKSEKSVLATNLRKMKSEHRNLVLGMTGTLMSNDHSELWNLIDLVETNYLGDWDEFKVQIAQPIKLARSKTASRDLIEISQAKARALNDKLHRIFIRRSKEDVLKFFLPKKNEKVVMCELSPLQKIVYQHILTLPDVENARTANSPCDCGVNAGFFHRYQRLRTLAERFAYYREHRKQIMTRGKCCYRIPRNPSYEEGGTEPKIHPDAVIWRMMKVHLHGDACKLCPSCCGLPALSKLYKLGDHLALLQAVKTPGSEEAGSPEHLEFMKSLEFAKVALPHVVDQIPGKSYIRRDGIMDDHFELSGKLRVLDKLLETFNKDGSRVLLFSYSTQSLDLIQNYIRSRGHQHLRMDGKTANSLRQELVDTFNRDPNIFIFLLSTKAMGTGLNLTSANKVIIFDVEWNPSNDEQAQDRAYRIGQRRDVEVLRLVSQGTIDELKYLRQLYKVHLKQETLVDEASAKPRAARLFRGVQGDKYRKGELFGYVNLFRFKDGSFLNDIWKRTGREVATRSRGDLVMHEASALSDALLGIGGDKVDEVLDDEPSQIEALVKSVYPGASGEAQGSLNKGNENNGRLEQQDTSGTELNVQAFDHRDLFREDRGRAAVEQGEEGFDEEMGGATQNLVEIFEEGVVMLPENPQDGSADPPEQDHLNNSNVTVRSDSDPRSRSRQDLPVGAGASEAFPPVDHRPQRELAAIAVIPVLPPSHLQEPRWIVGSDTEPSADESDGNSRETLGANKNQGTTESISNHLHEKEDTKTSEASLERKLDTSSNRKEAPNMTSRNGLNLNLFGSVSKQLKEKETCFSASDLFLPSYKKRKHK